MNIEFVRFKTTDSVELQGWLSDAHGEVAILHIHGMAGNGYENYFLDNLREMYIKKGLSFFSIDTRGRGITSDFRQGDGWKRGGSCFEIFDESANDIQGALDYLRSRNKKRFILQGHSLGCTKVVNYLITQGKKDIQNIILLAPTDMIGWAETDPRHEEYLAKAKQLLVAGKGEELVGAQCWPLDKQPLSAQTYVMAEAGSSADIYGEREGGALLGRIDLPVLIPYGTADIGITEIDGTIENYIERLNKLKHNNTTISTIKGSSHGFRGFEEQLAQIIEEFVQ